MTCSHNNKYTTGFGKITYDYCPDCKEEVKAEAFEEQSENPCAAIAAKDGHLCNIPYNTRYLYGNHANIKGFSSTDVEGMIQEYLFSIRNVKFI